MQNRKRRRVERPTIHPRNKYSENPPDFRLLASLYPSFEPFVFYSRDGRPRIDWTNFNATRELTRVLLDHDHGVKWWIPDGQLCPTVPNRSNYIHWIEDLLSSDIIAKANPGGDEIKGFDIGTGANCIYPILGASLFGWSFVGSDVTDVALEWAERNVKNNPHISELIEIRKVGIFGDTLLKEETIHDQLVSSETKSNLDRITEGEVEPLPSNSVDLVSDVEKYYGPPLLLGVVKDGENFDFCMCNPPFFETMDKAGLNPKTSCGGTPEEMVCPGGERAFITRIIEDSVFLKHTFRWYSSMIGRKSNLKILIAKLRDAGVTVVRTTEFVQGQTCRWGLAWSFMPLIRKTITSNWSEKSNQSFVLEGLQHQSSAIQVLKSIESFFVSSGASCVSKSSCFVIDVTASNDHCCSILENGLLSSDETGSSLHPLLDKICFRVSVFQQIPGTLLIKGSLQHGYKTVSGVFSLIFQRLEEILKMEFCREGSLVDH